MKKRKTPNRRCLQRSVRRQYRVVWKRIGLPEKKKRYEHLKNAQRFATLLGPEPWKITGQEPDEKYCCSGYMCACGGRTIRDEFMDKRENMPAIEYIRIEEREIQPGAWTPNGEITDSRRK